MYQIDALPGGRARPPASDPVVLRVLPSMNVRAFYFKVIKTFKVPKASQQSVHLWLHMPDDRLVEIERDDSHDLYWWGIENGVELFTFVQT